MLQIDYNAILTCLTGYYRHGYSLSQLNTLAILKDECIVDVRYLKHYKISEEELEWLAEWVNRLRQLMKDCVKNKQLRSQLTRY